MIKTMQSIHHETYQTMPTDYYFSPGRLNMLGAHTSISGGFTLSASTSIGVYFAFNLNDDGVMKVFHKQSFNQPLELTQKTDPQAHHFQAVLSKLLYEGYTMNQGFNLTIYNQLPVHIGLSSKTTTTIGLIRVLLLINNHPYKPEKLIKFAHQIEQANSITPTSYGQQMNALYGKKNQAIFISNKDYNYEYAPLHFPDYRWFILNTNYQEKSLDQKLKSRYNDIKEGTKFMFHKRPIDDLCDVEFNDFNRLKHEIKDQNILKRLEHVIFENDRALQGYKALQKNQYSVLFELLNHSQESLTKLFEINIPEIEYLVDRLNTMGALATRMTGTTKSAGLLAIFDKDSTPTLDSLTEYYEKRFKRRLEIIEISSGNGFHKIKNV